jgi:hypothetical protein
MAVVVLNSQIITPAGAGGSESSLIGSSFTILEEDDFVSVPIDNTANAHPVAVELSLLGLDAAEFALSSTLVAVEASGTDSVDVERAPGSTAAFAATLDVIHSNGELQSIDVYSEELLIVTSYSNPLSTGNRTGLMTVGFIAAPPLATGSSSNWINGTTGTNQCWFSSGYGSIEIKFNLGGLYVIDEAKLYASGTWKIGGQWQWYGSLDDVVWDPIGTDWEMKGATGGQVLTELAGNVTFYSYYKIVQISGTTAASADNRIREFEFKITA